jgi:hypothetical protein
MKGPEFYTWSESDDEDPEDRDKPIRSGKFKIKRKGVGVIDFDEYEDHVDMYCPHCLKYADVKNKLGPRILEKDKPVPEDHEMWQQCYTCGNIYGLHEIAQIHRLRILLKPLIAHLNLIKLKYLV